MVTGDNYTSLSGTSVVPNTLHKSYKILNPKEGISVIQTTAVLEYSTLCANLSVLNNNSGGTSINLVVVVVMIPESRLNGLLGVHKTWTGLLIWTGNLQSHFMIASVVIFNKLWEDNDNKSEMNMYPCHRAREKKNPFFTLVITCLSRVLSFRSLRCRGGGIFLVQWRWPETQNHTYIKSFKRIISA